VHSKSTAGAAAKLWQRPHACISSKWSPRALSGRYRKRADQAPWEQLISSPGMLPLACHVRKGGQRAPRNTSRCVRPWPVRVLAVRCSRLPPFRVTPPFPFVAISCISACQPLFPPTSYFFASPTAVPQQRDRYQFLLNEGCASNYSNATDIYCPRLPKASPVASSALLISICLFSFRVPLVPRSRQASSSLLLDSGSSSPCAVVELFFLPKGCWHAI
jgi:hypothetical protein